MVDSRKGRELMERDDLTERVEVIEVKLDHLTDSVTALSGTVTELSASVDRRFDEVDRRFDEAARAADEAFLEHRQYIEFVYTQLDTKMDTGFSRVDGHLARLEPKIDRVIELVSGKG